MNQIFQDKPIFKYLLTAVLIFVLIILQTTVVRGVEVCNVIPNLLVVMVVCYSLLHGDYSALAVGAVCGLLLDIHGGRTVGMNALLCTLLAYLCVCVSGNLYNNNSFVALVFVLFLSMAYDLVIYIFNFAIWGHGNFVFVLLHKILPGSVYNSLVTLFLYPLVRRLTVFK